MTNSTICLEYGLETGANGWQIRQRFGTNAAACLLFFKRANTEAPNKDKKTEEWKTIKTILSDLVYFSYISNKGIFGPSL